MISRWLNRSSISAWGALPNMVFSMTLISTSPIAAVKAVAITTCCANYFRLAALLKYVSFQRCQKYTITAIMVQVCNMTSKRVIGGEDGSRPRSFSTTTTCAELETGKSSASPCTTARITLWIRDTC